REVRLDFGLNSLPPGGAGRVGDARFRSILANNFSARWTGQLIPRFTETYTFKVVARDTFRLRLRPAGGSAWTTVIDQVTPTNESAGTMALTESVLYDVEAVFSHAEGAWAAQLFWSSPSFLQEVIDPGTQSGINNPEWSSGFTDIVKGARNSWEGVNGGARPAMDTNGWPMGDGAFVFQESLNQGLDVDPLMRGRITFSFHGSATVSLQGNVRNGSLTSKYDAAQNLTTGSFIATNTGWNASYFRFTNARRNGQPGGSPGITDLRLMRPVAPDSAVSYDSTNSLFTPQLLDAMGHFTVVRHQYVANQQRDWSERTPPGYFNQSGGTMSAPHYGVGEASQNGASWEHKILLANETGRDLMLSLPTVASGRTPDDTESYIWKLANLLRYGSDGVEPYTSPVANPVYPPLNPNLRVYLELENELWNWGGVFYVDWANVNALMAADADAGNADFQAINFDGLSTAKDGSGNYVSMNTWRFRKIMLRTMQISDIFRAVFGDAGMMTRVRPLYEWQYANDNDTARLALTFVDRYFNNGDGQNHVANPQPVSHWFWGGGGATYYGAVNGNGLTTLLPDPNFSTPVLSQAGYQMAPSGGSWTFSGTAGIARDGGSSDDIPPAFKGSQMAFITDRGSISIPVVFPEQFTSPVFGVSFKAVNRTKTGASAADRENLRVYLDGTNDITARTFSQGNGYTAPGYDAGHPWSANNVFWTHSEYY
ncbi:MAG TPA: PA14 domain-containing protein, partial [Clostridia bacterium]|nr:PA14 domain-containing protein [Clostridia bacterium]